MKKQLAIISKTRKIFEKSILNKIDSNFDWIHIPGAGIEKYLHLKKFKKIEFTCSKKIQGEQVSDHAMALLLSISRKLTYISRYGQSVKFDFRPLELNKKRALVIGYGGIGKLIAIKSHAFGMKVQVVTNRSIPKNKFIEKIFKYEYFDQSKKYRYHFYSLSINKKN